MEVKHIEQCRNKTQNLIRILVLGQNNFPSFPYHVLFYMGERAGIILGGGEPTAEKWKNFVDLFKLNDIMEYGGIK